MTINVETDHPHGEAHVTLFTCQHRLAAAARPRVANIADRYLPVYPASPTEHHDNAWNEASKRSVT
jgi:hypothetical protein